MVTIYALVCPLSNEIRYIWKTEKAPRKRLLSHLKEAKSSDTSHKKRWLRKCIEADVIPSIWVLEEVPEGVRWQDRERDWISKALIMGLPLTNQTEGGEGLIWLDPEDRARYSELHARISKARYHENQELKMALVEGARRSWRENREARLEAMANGWTPGAKARHIEAMQAARRNPKFRENRSNASKQIWVDHRDTIMAAFARPETKARQSESKKMAWQDPRVRVRMKNRWTPERRAEQAERIASRREKMVPTPEGREKQRQAMRDYWAKKRAQA